MFRIGESVKKDIKYHYRPGIYGIIIVNNNILLTEQNEEEIQLPGGGIDEGEHYIKALVRETFEESGIRISKSDIVAGPVNDSYLTMWLAEVPWGTNVHIAVNPVSGKLEHDGYEWLSQQEAEQNCYPYLRSFVTWAFKHI